MRSHVVMPRQEVSRVYCTNGRYDVHKSENRRQELKTLHPITVPNHPQPKRELVDSFFNLFKKH